MTLLPGFQALVVDDHEICREVADSVLRKLGASAVAKAPDGSAALAWADATGHQLDLVVCDLRMPQVDGIETLVGLASRTRPALVVIASGADDRLLRAAAETVTRAGIDNVQSVAKPLTIEKMQAALAGGNAAAADRWARAEAHTLTLPDCSTRVIRGMSNGEFVPFFQPKMAADRPIICGAETHLRWLHAGHGVLSPESFIGIAETTGLFSDLFYAFFAQIAVF